MANCPCTSIGADKFIPAMLVYIASWPRRVATVGQIFSIPASTVKYLKVRQLFHWLGGGLNDNGRIFECTPRYW